MTDIRDHAEVARKLRALADKVEQRTLGVLTLQDLGLCFGNEFWLLVLHVALGKERPTFVPPTDIDGLRVAIGRIDMHIQHGCTFDVDATNAWEKLRTLVEAAWLGVGPFTKQERK